MPLERRPWSICDVVLDDHGISPSRNSFMSCAVADFDWSSCKISFDEERLSLCGSIIRDILELSWSQACIYFAKYTWRVQGCLCGRRQQCIVNLLPILYIHPGQSQSTWKHICIWHQYILAKKEIVELLPRSKPLPSAFPWISAPTSSASPETGRWWQVP